MFRFFLSFFLILSVAGAEDDLESQVKRFAEAYAIVEQNAADPVSADQAFYQGAIPGMTKSSW